MTFEKNQLVDVLFEDITHEGAGVCKPEGMPIFVPGGLPGEKAQIKITKMQKTHGFGRLMKVLKPSPNRVEPKCEVYNQCGGCQLQHLSYDGQLEAKQKIVRDAMERIGKIPHATIHPVIGMEEPWSYRNKAQVPVGESGNRLVVGFYGKRSHEIIDMKKCYIQMDDNDQAVQTVKDICQKHGLRAYNEEIHKGVLRHILVRSGKISGEIMVVLVTRLKEFPIKDAIVADIVKAIPGLKSIVQNINPDRTNVILGKESNVLWGEEVIYDSIGDVKFAISANSFYQVNPIQTQVLYEKALEYAALTGEETVIDAYCGVGTISLFLAQNAKKVYGVEVVKEAIEDANKNAELNGISNVEFVVGEADQVMTKWIKEEIHADVVVVDPPRKGCEPWLLSSIIEMAPSRVVYVSCNPATLARDLRILEDGGYRTVEIQPVDLFPQTGHVECVVLLIKN